MPLRFTSHDTAHGADMVRAHIRKIPATGGHPLLAGRTFNTGQMNPPHAIYGLHPRHFANGKSLDDSTVYCGFRYLVESDGQPHMAAEVRHHPRMRGHYDVVLNVGQFVGATAHGLKLLAGRLEVHNASYEVRLLRFFPLYLEALWLKPDGHGSDLIHPLHGGAPAPLVGGQVYNLEEFRKNIAILLQQRAHKA